jgi:hypothetical protein
LAQIIAEYSPLRVGDVVTLPTSRNQKLIVLRVRYEKGTFDVSVAKKYYWTNANLCALVERKG